MCADLYLWFIKLFGCYRALCPPEHQDYSDDEQERAAKRARGEKARKRKVEAAMLEAMAVLQTEKERTQKPKDESQVEPSIGNFKQESKEVKVEYSEG